MLRAANKTVSGYVEQHLVLVSASLEGLPIACSVRGEVIPEGWTGDAFCTHLYRASRSELLLLTSAQREAVSSVQSISACLQSSTSTDKRGSVQHKFYKAIRQNENDEWPALLARRADTLLEGGIAGLNGWDLVPWPCPSFSEWFLTEQWEREFSQVVRRMPCKIKHTVLKAWANSWCTTTRLHESFIWPCIFGCDEKDTLSHYLRCPRLWSSISSVTKTELVFVDPLVKTGLVNPSARMLKHLAIASRVYHTLKFDFHCDVTAAIDCGDFCEIHALLVELVEHYCNEFKVT
jgi:hypothetical protein